MVGIKRVISKIQNRNIFLGLTYNCQKEGKVYQRVWRTRNVLTAALLSQTYNSLKNSSRKQGLKFRCEDSKTSKVIEPPKPKLLCAGCVLIGITRWSPVNELTEETVYVLYIWQWIIFFIVFCKETRPEKIRTSHCWIEIINWRFNLYDEVIDATSFTRLQNHRTKKMTAVPCFLSYFLQHDKNHCGYGYVFVSLIL